VQVIAEAAQLNFSNANIGTVYKASRFSICPCKPGALSIFSPLWEAWLPELTDPTSMETARER
jgi:hypothetical protein